MDKRHGGRVTGAATHSARAVPLVVGRTPLLPGDTVQALYDARDPERYVRDLISSRPEIAQAVYAASPSLGEATAAWLGGAPWSNTHGFLRLAAYVLRMASRATPFGLFASIACVDVAERTTLALAEFDTIRTHSRPDMAWLLGLIRDVEARDDVRDSLPVFWNDHALHRGGRIHVRHPDGRVTRSGDRYAAEFVASLVTTAHRAALPVGAATGDPPDNGLGPGSEWCYVKLYCGRSNIDDLLARSVAPLLDDLIERSIVDRWFFIRYNDPHSHVRLRMRATAAGRGVLLATVAQRCELLLSTGVVERYAFDTYARELERYGGSEHFDDVESVFHRDSVAALEALRDRPSTPDTRIRLAVETLDTVLLRMLPAELVETALNGARSKRRRLTARAQKMIKELQTTASSAPRAHRSGALAYLFDPAEAIVRSFVHMHFNRMGVHDEDESVATEMALRVLRGLTQRERIAPPRQPQAAARKPG